jgi:hypothetical protein
MVKELQINHGIHVPLSLALFGGYRKDDFDSVLALHAGDLVICLKELCSENADYNVNLA